MTPVIELDDVSAGYPRNPVFTHLSLSIPQGQFVGIIGPTGSGKTTLIKSMLGVHELHGGVVRVMGQSIKKMPPGSIGYVPQLETVDWTFPVTVEQVILMGLYTNRTYLPWPSRDEKRRVAELAERLGIGDLLDRHIRNISGGQQQRTFLARALINNPKLLILDEPTSGVDMKTQHEVLHQLQHLNREGISIVITTHDLNAVAAHLPWVVCFNKTVIAEGRPKEVLTEENLRKTYGGDLTVIEHGEYLLISHKAHHHHHHHH